MNKAELSSRLASECSLTRAEADHLVGAVFATIAGFGTFATRTRAARQGRNPRTGEAISIAASRAPAFKAGKALREALNRARA